MDVAKCDVRRTGRNMLLMNCDVLEANTSILNQRSASSQISARFTGTMVTKMAFFYYSTVVFLYLLEHIDGFNLQILRMKQRDNSQSVMWSRQGKVFFL